MPRTERSGTRRGERIVTEDRRSLAGLLGFVGLAGFVALAVAVHGHRSTRFDLKVLTWLYRHVTGRWPHLLLFAGDPIVPIAVLAIAFVGALVAWRGRLAIFVVAAPTVASGITELIAKPIINRPFGNRTPVGASYAFPSGHETLTASAAITVAVAVLWLPWPRIARALLVVVLAVWTVGVAVGLVVNFFHYATDVIGAIALSLAVVLGLALLIERLPLPRRRRGVS